MTFEHGIRRIVLAGSIAVAGIAGWLAHVDLTSATTPPPDHFCADLAAARQAPLPADVDRSKIADPALRTEYEAMPRESGIEHDTRKLAWYYEQHRRYDKPLPVTEAEFLQTYRQQHRDASDAMAADQWRVIQRHPGIVAAWDDAERYVAAWRDACPAWWATVRRAMTVIGWSLGAGAAVWALFFFLRWIVMGFRGRRSPGTGEVMSHTDDLMGLVRRLADYVEHPDGWSEFWFGDNGMLYVEHAKRAVSLAGGEQRLGEALTLVSVKLTALGSPLVTGMNRVDVAATLRLAASAIEGKQ